MLFLEAQGESRLDSKGLDIPIKVAETAASMSRVEILLEKLAPKFPPKKLDHWNPSSFQLRISLKKESSKMRVLLGMIPLSFTNSSNSSYNSVESSVNLHHPWGMGRIWKNGSPQSYSLTTCWKLFWAVPTNLLAPVGAYHVGGRETQGWQDMRAKGCVTVGDKGC